MIKNIQEEFIKFIEGKELINKNDGIVVGLSGGPDSVCLLKLLLSIKEKYNLEIVAAHINHMLRGETADADEEFCKELCMNLNIEFYSTRVDINRYSKERGLSSETAGREVRYNFFNEIMKKKKFNKIATAHNANDQAETIIMRIMRGTGLEGLCGIPVKRDDIYIRPILFMERAAIESYCEEIDIRPRIDESNLERDYSRNKVRLDILPYMKEHFNSDVIQTINRMGSLLQEDNRYILNVVEETYKRVCLSKDDSIIIKNEVFSLDNTIKMRVIRKAIRNVCGNNYDVEMKHIEEVISLASNSTGKKIDLPNGIVAINIYGDIKIMLVKHGSLDISKSEKVLSKNQVIHNNFNFNNYIVECEVIENHKNIVYNTKSLIKYFDFDKINGNIVFRYRKNGDRIIPLGLRGSKKVKDIFIDMKIPKEERDSIPIIEFDNDIAWIVGLKISDKYKIDSNTRKILKIQLKERNFDMYKDIEKVLYSEEMIDQKVKEMAKQISEDYKGKDFLVVVILKGSVIFAADLIKRITVHCNMDFMAVSSYGSGTESSGNINIKKDIDYNIEGKNILIVEDIVDSGLTLKYLVDYFKERKVNSVNIATLLDKPSRRSAEVDVKYSGFEVPNEFLVGYGLDYDERYRNLPFIGILKPEVYEK